MKLSQLLHARTGLVQRASLANLAFAYHVLADFSARVARARLAGTVTLQSADPAEDRYWPTLTAHDFNQSLLEEHFTEENLAELADTIAYLSPTDAVDRTVRIEELAGNYLAVLRTRLEQAGIEIDAEASASRPSTAGPAQDASSDRSPSPGHDRPRG